jgi:integrase
MSLPVDELPQATLGRLSARQDSTNGGRGLVEEPLYGSEVEGPHSQRDAPEMFECATRWELFNERRNPIALVRVKGGSKRRQRPTSLTVEEFELIVATLQEPWRTMVQIAQCLGLRVSEIAALQWDDFDFDKNQLLVQRSFVNGRVDHVKTEYSQDYVPLHPSLTEIVLKWSTQAVPTEEG